MESEEQTQREELFKEICTRLRATDETARAEAQRRIGEIGSNLERNEAEAAAADAVTLGKARSALDAEIKRIEKQPDIPDTPETFLRYGGTATDNPFADPAIHQQAAEEDEETLRKRQAVQAAEQDYRAAQQEYVADLRKRRENPNWEGTRGPTIKSMIGGTPGSDFVADCLKMFEAFRPGECSHTEGGDLYVVAKNIYELIKGRSLLEEDADFSLAHRLREAVAQYRKTIPT